MEDWLSVFARYSDAGSATSPAGQQALAHGLSEEGARAMITLAEAIKDAEIDRQSQLQQIIQMNAQLSMLNEQMADDKRTRDMLGLLNARIEQLTRPLPSNLSANRKPFQAKCARCPRPLQSWHPPNIQIDKGRLNGTFPSRHPQQTW